MFSSAIILLALPLVNGANNWKEPCFQGECSYDLRTNNDVTATLKIWGSPNAISDITPAGGWTIIGCDQDALAQNIRLVCNSPAEGCDHLFQSGGPVGKIVRLPENCGKSAFARVAKAWIPKDQSIPANIRRRLARRQSFNPDGDFFDPEADDTTGFETAADSTTDDDDGSASSFDGFGSDSGGAPDANANFGNVDATSGLDNTADNTGASGNAADGSNPQVQALALDTNFDAVDPSKNGNVNIAIQGATIPGENGDLTITPPTPTRRRSRRRRIQSRRGLLTFIEDAFDKFNNFDASTSQNLPPIDVSKTFNVFEKSISCPASGNIPAIDASVKADVITKAHAVITLGIAAAGTIVPPQLTGFGLFAGMDAQLDATLSFVGNAAGKADSGRLTFFEVGVPGLDFPGIISIGPTFKIQGQATATLDINVNMDIDLSYSVNGAKLFFPPSANHESGGVFIPGNAPLKLSVSPSLQSKAVVAAHLIPRLDVGVSALGGKAQATIFLDLDSSASVTMTLNAAANADASIDTVDAVANGNTNVNTSASGSVDGCVSANAALNANAGADGSFFGLFDRSTQVNLFTKDFEIFKKCFGTQKRSAIPRRVSQRRAISLSCPTAASSSLVALTQ